MDFIEFVAVVKRHKSLVRAGLVAAVLLAIFSSYRLDGLRLVSRSQPTYETTAVVAIKPGAAIPSLPATTPPEVTTTTLAPIGSVPVPADTSVATTATPTAATGASDLDVVIDSRALYYSALSIQTAVVAPGFAERVNDALPTMDGSISAVVPLDTNTIRLVVDGSSPSRATATMQVALEQLQPLVDSYATSGAFRFTLEAEVISGPSTPTSVSSIKGPLTATVVFGVAIVLLWLGLRAYDVLQLPARGSDHSTRIPRPHSESSGLEPDVDEPDVDEPDVDVLLSSDPVSDTDVDEPDVDVLLSSDPVSDTDQESAAAAHEPESEETASPALTEALATSDSEPDLEQAPAPSSRTSRRRRVVRDLEDETPSASPR